MAAAAAAADALYCQRESNAHRLSLSYAATSTQAFWTELRSAGCGAGDKQGDVRLDEQVKGVKNDFLQTIGGKWLFLAALSFVRTDLRRVPVCFVA